jgi:4a-hydroxytetrahydrobiopterin dehydratase
MILSEEDVDERLELLPGWTSTGTSLVRRYTFESFPFAVAFVNCLGMDAEVRDHHPDLLISHKRVTVTWTSHDAGGITEKDFTGVHESDRLAAAMGHRD